MQVRLAARAITDLESIQAYIARDNPAAARRIAVAIVAATERLGTNPRVGRLGAFPGTFELVVRPYVLVYEIQRAEVIILRIWHGRQRRPGT
jgi:toxin ParE1/3/4